MYENMIVIDRKAPESLQKQIRRQLAIGILNRQYPLHRPLPSICRLSRELGVSVTTVALAYEALKQDGFVEGRNRSGFYVNQDVLADPGHALKLDEPLTPPDPPSPSPSRLRRHLHPARSGRVRSVCRSIPGCLSGACSDALYVGSHELFEEAARRQAARRHRVGARLQSDRQYLHSSIPPRVTRGHLRHYAEQVAPAADGAVLLR